MTSIDKPYFMTDESWYYFDEEAWKYRLTSVAPDEARRSYEEFYSTLEGSYFEIDDPTAS